MSTTLEPIAADFDALRAAIDGQLHTPAAGRWSTCRTRSWCAPPR